MKVKDIYLDNLTISVYCFELINERMYLIKHTENMPQKKAIVIDPFKEKELLKDLDGIDFVMVILTHEHFDHISGVNWLKMILPCEIIAGIKCAHEIQSTDNGTSRFPLLFIHDRTKYHYVKEHYTFPYYCKVDHTFEIYEMIIWGNHKVCLYETPGHSTGSISIIIDNKIIFSGDNLLGNGQELKSVHSNSENYRKTLEFYEQYKNRNILVFPGHGDVERLEIFLEKIRSYFEWN